ncbi:putative transcription factor bHLH family [Helianthus annuus]|nr:putative transcription factor bHLH family [Helianthus annuus]
MMEHKWSPVSIEQGNLTSLTPKRHKAGLSISPKVSSLSGLFTVERKDKVGERIAALQQLVSPYGKTDTASVLLEAIEYIHFLHDQVKVSSAPYLHSNPTAQSQDLDSYNLKAKGLCLVPVSYMNGVGSSNGADIWAPIKTPSPKW